MDAYEIKQYRRGKLIHIRLSPRTHQRLKIRVAELKTTLQRFVSRTVRRALLPPKDKAPKKPKPLTVEYGPVKPLGAKDGEIKPPVTPSEAPKVDEAKKPLETKIKRHWKGKAK